MKPKDSQQENYVLLCQLALERCQVYLSHLMAITHLYTTEQTVSSEMRSRSVTVLLNHMQDELTVGLEALEQLA